MHAWVCVLRDGTANLKANFFPPPSADLTAHLLASLGNVCPVNSKEEAASGKSALSKRSGSLQQNP